MREVFIVDAVRTPIGKYRGSLSKIRPDDLAATVIKGIIQRNPGLNPLDIEDIFLGCSNQSGEDNRNIARMALLLAGLPETTGGTTVNRLCGSGLEAVNQAVATIKMGAGDIMIAGGVESMSRAPFVMLKPEEALIRGNQALVDTTLGWRFINPALARMYEPISMGETAENVAQQFNISRIQQDNYACISQERCRLAWKEEKFSEEIIPVPIYQKDQLTYLRVDEHPRPDTNMEKLTQLLPIFRDGGSVTAGNSSGINDGASALLLMEKETMIDLNMKPLAKVISFAVTGVHPHMMGVGPVEATKKVLNRSGLTIQDIDLIELNEAFAAQVLACTQLLDVDLNRVNVNGGAIAIGHPLGASGARILTTLVHELKRSGGHYGLATLCVGVGQGIATLVERV